MEQVKYYDNSNSTSRLLNELEEDFDEAKLTRMLIHLYNQLYKVETFSGPSPRTLFLRREISALEFRLSELKGKRGD